VISTDPLRLLYVEDNRINAILFEGALRIHNTSVELRVAEDGEEALAIAAQWTPEVLVLDAHLPGMSGFDVLRQLRQLPALARTPAFMCSADAMPEDLQRARAAGFVGYWTKPIDIAGVLADIQSLNLSLRNQTA
jgi:CheY-like chemotaxis protein